MPPLATLLVAVAVLSGLTSAAQAQLALVGAAPDGESRPSSRGRALTDWSSPESIQALAAASSPDLKALIAKSGGPAAFAKAIDQQLGPELEVYDEQTLTLNGLSMYLRLARYARAPAALTRAAWNEEGTVLAAGVAPAPPPVTADTPPAQTPLALPFAEPRAGVWLTYWGGRNAVRNHHVVSPDQLYAYDFLVVRDGRTFEGASDRNESYFCWGEPVLAAAAGRVARVVDGVADNTPGVTNNPKQPAGNHVVIEHRPGEFSLSGHLRRGSVAVRPGQAVAAGQRIGACGNSGNSSEPHLHFHLQTADAFGEGRGLPAPFQTYLADGAPVTNGQPVRGQRLSHAP